MFLFNKFTSNKNCVCFPYIFTESHSLIFMVVSHDLNHVTQVFCMENKNKFLGM